MQKNLEALSYIKYLTGSAEIAAILPDVPAMVPFDKQIIDFLNDVSRRLITSKVAKLYADVISFAFWIRRGSVLKLKERFEGKDVLRLGRGVAFHIAPSNVPVNFAYTLAAGLLMGNANIVRVPSKEFPQVEIITDAINKSLKVYTELKKYVLCVRYDRNKEINDLFSSVADIRVIWGGDHTIAEIRKSPLMPRSVEITFADRYSLAVIDAEAYLSIDNKRKVAEDFYNDTFLTDQNACTSPRIIIWTGTRKEEAKKIFWNEEHKLVEQKYTFQFIQGVNKLTKAYIIATTEPGIKVEEHTDNLIVRISVPRLTETLMEYRDNSGYFYEYNCSDIMELLPLCNDKRCQTIGYIGNKSFLYPLIKSGMKGIDRVVPIGQTMDFDLIWDGYDLPSLMTRTVVLK